MPQEPINPSRWQRIALWPLACLFFLWGRTLRIRISAEDKSSLSKIDGPAVFVFWHNHLLAVLLSRRFFKRGLPFAAMVSNSRDGAVMAALFSHLGISAIRGSSFGRGSEAVWECIHALRAGNDVAITPDGSRGPIYEFKRGALSICRGARRPVLLIGAHFHTFRRTRSWDGLFLPLPFSRIDYHLRVLENPKAVLGHQKQDESVYFRQALFDLCGEKKAPPGLPVKVE